ncbi:50S ribosomal protein L9 [Ignavibacteria bacterium CHB1]|nr:MAG: 50S ribosomal protein L9 [Chlorobiota bacterium]MBV6399298.1 50S ribosomal protein L9 [Ignavibacteria bacterium]MCC6884971.1 50S ribosomal protein L9 [Ignavibacteriales bacterium]MCE7953498.1 50S ribosomal protein L9 [Chlorobi bacterium CHB7]MDL1887612.1 50S ribosomal protein L9 [Ignavibacteria bacterium CHB1]RIK49311.1 MAG: 50S ribosomal protein L9 [Ignavibacteriota bacterium]
MKIILRKDYEFLGGVGEIFEVKDGYARNFLIPNGIAFVATDSNIKSVNEIKKQQGRKLEKQVEDSKSLAGVIEKTSIVIPMKTSEGDKLHGSVTSQMIYDLLISQEVPEFDKRKIVLKEPIKTLGEHEIEVKLHSAVSAHVKVVVHREGEDYTQSADIEQASETITESTDQPEEELNPGTADTPDDQTSDSVQA